jgi:hypothetical protein
MRQLKSLSNQAMRSDTDRLKRLQTWCAEAEASGIRALHDFAPAPGPRSNRSPPTLRIAGGTLEAVRAP